MYIPPKPEAVVHIFKKEIKMKTCEHLNEKNVEKDLVLYKIINKEGIRDYFGTCSLCYMTNISRKHGGKRDD